MLLLDEPFSALDTHLRSHLSQQLFSRLNTFAGTTLLVTHNLTEAYRANRLVVLHQGQAVQKGEPECVFKQPKTEAIAQLTGPCNVSPVQLQRQFQRQPHSPSSIYAQHWQLSLSLPKIIPLDSSQKPYSVGIRPQNVLFMTPAKYRSHQTPPKSPDRMTFLSRQGSPPPTDLAANQAYCWPTHYWHKPNSVTVLVTLHQPANSPDDYQLQVIVSHETWQQQQRQVLPWTVYLPAHHLILLRP